MSASTRGQSWPLRSNRESRQCENCYNHKDTTNGEESDEVLIILSLFVGVLRFLGYALESIIDGAHDSATCTFLLIIILLVGILSLALITVDRVFEIVLHLLRVAVLLLLLLLIILVFTIWICKGLVLSCFFAVAKHLVKIF